MVFYRFLLDDFEEIDTFYYDEEDLEQRMDKYVKLHAAEFVVKGDYLYAD